MKVKINDELKEIPEDSKITDILKAEEIIEPVAVDVFVNGEKVNFEDYESFKLKEGDEIEIVYLFASG